MAEFSYYSKLINEAIAADKAGIGRTRLINDLVDQCTQIAKATTVVPEANLADRYHEEFYLEFLSIGLTLIDSFSSTYKSAGRLFNNTGYIAQKGNRGRDLELPVLLAWYFWKSADCNRNKRFDNYKIDWNSTKNAENEWFPELVSRLDELSGIRGKPATDHVFEWIDPHRILSSDDSEAVEAFKEEIRQRRKARPLQKPQKLDWIHPYNSEAIPFVGREGELTRLDAFAGNNTEGADFKIWVMVAPSGAGKTRLTYEWIKRPPIDSKWRVLYLGLDASDDGAEQKLTCLDCRLNKVPLDAVSLDTVSKNNKNGSDWSGWSPSKPHIFIIDYVFGFAGVIKGLVERARENAFSKPVRLLVLDHTFPRSFDQFQADPRWSWASSDGERMSAMKPMFYNEGKPLDLSSSNEGDATDLKTDLLSAVIRSTVERAVECHEDEDQLRREIDEGTLAEALAFLKTQPNAEYPLFAALVGDAIRRKHDFSNWNRRDLANYYLSGKQRLPWENRLLREEDSYWGASLVAAATALRGFEIDQLNDGSGNDLPDDLQPVIDICSRLTSRTVNELIQPFEPDYIGESFFLVYLQRLLKKPAMLEVFRAMLSRGSIDQQFQGALAFLAFMQRLTGNLLNDDQLLPATQQHWRNLLAFLKPEKFEQNTLFRWAVSTALVNHYARINQARMERGYSEGQIIEWPDSADGLYHQFRGGWTALMIACRYDQEQAALAMIAKMDVLDQQNDDDATALTIACRDNHEQAALAMIEKMDRIDQQDNNGVTALMISSLQGLTAVAEALMLKGANINTETQDGMTALLAASFAGRLECVELLLAQPHIKIDAAWAYEGKIYSALDLAEAQGNAEVADLIQAAMAERAATT